MDRFLIKAYQAGGMVHNVGLVIKPIKSPLADWYTPVDYSKMDNTKKSGLPKDAEIKTVKSNISSVAEYYNDLSLKEYQEIQTGIVNGDLNTPESIRAALDSYATDHADWESKVSAFEKRWDPFSTKVLDKDQQLSDETFVFNKDGIDYTFEGNTPSGELKMVPLKDAVKPVNYRTFHNKFVSGTKLSPDLFMAVEQQLEGLMSEKDVLDSLSEKRNQLGEVSKTAEGNVISLRGPSGRGVDLRLEAKGLGIDPNKVTKKIIVSGGNTGIDQFQGWIQEVVGVSESNAIDRFAATDAKSTYDNIRSLGLDSQEMYKKLYAGQYKSSKDLESDYNRLNEEDKNRINLSGLENILENNQLEIPDENIDANGLFNIIKQYNKLESYKDYANRLFEIQASVAQSGDKVDTSGKWGAGEEKDEFVYGQMLPIEVSKAIGGKSNLDWKIQGTSVPIEGYKGSKTEPYKETQSYLLSKEGGDKSGKTIGPGGMPVDGVNLDDLYSVTPGTNIIYSDNEMDLFSLYMQNINPNFYIGYYDEAIQDGVNIDENIYKAQFDKMLAEYKLVKASKGKYKGDLDYVSKDGKLSTKDESLAYIYNQVKDAYEQSTAGIENAAREIAVITTASGSVSATDTPFADKLYKEMANSIRAPKKKGVPQKFYFNVNENAKGIAKQAIDDANKWLSKDVSERTKDPIGFDAFKKVAAIIISNPNLYEKHAEFVEDAYANIIKEESSNVGNKYLGANVYDVGTLERISELSNMPATNEKDFTEKVLNSSAGLSLTTPVDKEWDNHYLNFRQFFAGMDDATREDFLSRAKQYIDGYNFADQLTNWGVTPNMDLTKEGNDVRKIFTIMQSLTDDLGGASLEVLLESKKLENSNNVIYNIESGKTSPQLKNKYSVLEKLAMIMPQMVHFSESQNEKGVYGYGKTIKDKQLRK